MRLGNSRGFTLIELVMIIVILGILAAVAIPRYLDLRTDAENAAIRGIYGQVAAAYGITIASVRRAPTVNEVNANISGDSGDLQVNSATDGSIQLNTGGDANTIQGSERGGAFNVTCEGGACSGASTIQSIGNLSLYDVP